jgi:hypothetical protein
MGNSDYCKEVSCLGICWLLDANVKVYEVRLLGFTWVIWRKYECLEGVLTNYVNMVFFFRCRGIVLTVCISVTKFIQFSKSKFCALPYCKLFLFGR